MTGEMSARKVLCGLIGMMTVVSGCVLISTERAVAESEDGIIFSEDFESYATGTFPSTFDLIYDGAGDSYQVVTDEYSSSGDKSLKLKGEIRWGVKIEHHISIADEDIVWLSGDIMPGSLEEETDCSCCEPESVIHFGFHNGESDYWVTNFGSVLFDTNGDIRFQKGTNNYEVIGSWTSFTWYHIEIKLSLNDELYEVYIDDTLSFTGYIDGDPSLIDSIALVGGHSGVTSYCDNVASSTAELEEEDDEESSICGSYIFVGAVPMVVLSTAAVAFFRKKK